ncbi:MAG: isopentenyl-diphosphate Delta-isomerase [Bacteroidota bacterium]
MSENVILVDADDNVIGTMNKMDAHLSGDLHRAFSIFIFNSKGELLLQQRAFDKYHSGGKWTNTCCSHPRLNEGTQAAAHRRLYEEMGMACELQYEFKFTYKALLTPKLIEHELDHVFFGISDDLPSINEEEVSSFKYMNIKDLGTEIIQNPDAYTAWLQICFPQVLEVYAKHFPAFDID